MNTKYNQSLEKTLGPQAARLVTALYEHKHLIFTLELATKILGDPNVAQQIVSRLVKKGIASRLKPGLFQLVPFDLGHEREYLGNPYLVAAQIAQFHRGTSFNISDRYYLSHGSAMDLHRMVTQPQLSVYVTTPRPIRPLVVLGTEFRFVRVKSHDFFGVIELWVGKYDKILVSDLERTILDGLKQPSYCGGLKEVAKGFWMRRTDVDPKKLVDYALKLDIGAVIRRLGFLMELYEISAPKEIERLHKRITATYQLLDPDLSPEGKFLARWRLRLNITKEELLLVGRT